MTRLRADLLLLLVAAIWGAAFVAQKTALEHMGAATFAAARFLLSALIVAPLAFHESRKNPVSLLRDNKREMSFLCLSFVTGVLLQQYGIAESSVAISGFLTALYVLFVPFVHWTLYRAAISRWIWPAAVLSVAGVYFLSGGRAIFDGGFGRGEWLLLGCAIAWALQVVWVGRLAMRTRAPFQLCFWQYAATVAGAGFAALAFEDPQLSALLLAWREIAYAGAVSGAIAYTIQVIAQQYTPPSDSAVICGAESVFAALSGYILIGETLGGWSIFGCALITAAILLVELAPRAKSAETL